MEKNMTDNDQQMVNENQPTEEVQNQANNEAEFDDVDDIESLTDEEFEVDCENIGAEQEQEQEKSAEQTEQVAEAPATQPDLNITTESVVEAVLFASDEPLVPNRLADIVGVTVKQVKEHVTSLNEKYQTNGNVFRIEQIAGGYQMLTLSHYNHWLKKLLRVRDDSKLSPAALETLAIVAYKQPIIRADIEAIRGVAAGEMIRSLIYKGLIKIVGRAEVLGRPMLYGTTKKFLEVFGLNSLKDLPKTEELKQPDL